jgi:Tfp pilus assembly major pilin PilA
MAKNRDLCSSASVCPLAECHPGHRQQGVTLATFAMALLLVGILAGTALRLLPLYVDRMKVRGALHDTKDQLIDNLRSQKTTDANGVAAQLMEKLRERGVVHVTRQDITVTPQDDGYSMVIDYDARTRWVGPIDLIMHVHLEQEASPL